MLSTLNSGRPTSVHVYWCLKNMYITEGICKSGLINKVTNVFESAFRSPKDERDGDACRLA